MSRSTGFAAGVVLMALATVGSAQAQIVHKCVVNGAAVYQAAACPVANDEKPLLPPPPSQQELLDATANGRLQQFQAGSGTLATSSQRRAIAGQSSRQPRPTGSPQQQAQEAAMSSCDQLNQSFHDLQYRRDELSAPGAGATRAEALQRVNDELKRTSEQANATHCKLR